MQSSRPWNFLPLPDLSRFLFRFWFWAGELFRIVFCVVGARFPARKMKGEGDNSDEDSRKEAVGGGGVTIEELQRKMAEFARERNWDQFHSPRNLLLALVGEVGELSEIFQWKGEVPKGLPDWSVAEKEHLGEELSDVLLYLVRLADICGVDLGEAALRKVKKNGLKYPVERCKGSSKKYTQLASVVNEEFRVENVIDEYI